MTFLAAHFCFKKSKARIFLERMNDQLQIKLAASDKVSLLSVHSQRIKIGTQELTKLNDMIK